MRTSYWPLTSYDITDKPSGEPTSFHHAKQCGHHQNKRQPNHQNGHQLNVVIVHSQPNRGDPAHQRQQQQRHQITSREQSQGTKKYCHGSVFDRLGDRV